MLILHRVTQTPSLSRATMTQGGADLCIFSPQPGLSARGQGLKIQRQ